MASVDYTGFDKMATVAEFFDGGAQVPSAAHSRSAGGKGVLVPNLTTLTKTLPVNTYTELYVGEAIRQDFATNNFIMLVEAGLQHLQVQPNGTRGFDVLRNSTKLGSTANNLWTAGVWGYLELYGRIHAVTGAYELRWNGQTVLIASGVNTKAGGTGIINQVQLNTPNPGNFAIDDLYINDATGAVDNGFWGDVRIDGLAPNGAGASAQFTPSAGSNYANVTSHDGDTSYNESSTAGQIDSHALEDLPAGSQTVLSARHRMTVRKTDAGTRTVRGKVRHGGVYGDGPTISVGNSYVTTSFEQRLNPSTGVLWTPAEIAAAEAGYELVT